MGVGAMACDINCESVEPVGLTSDDMPLEADKVVEAGGAGVWGTLMGGSFTLEPGAAGAMGLKSEKSGCSGRNWAEEGLP